MVCLQKLVRSMNVSSAPRIERSSKTSSYWGDWSNGSEFVLKYMLFPALTFTKLDFNLQICLIDAMKCCIAALVGAIIK